MDKIFLAEKLVAIHLRSFPQGTSAVSSPEDALQVLTMKRKKGEVAKLHRHIPKKRVTETLQECLIVMRGEVRYDLFDADKRRFREVIVRAGEAMLTLGVAHEVHFLEDAEAYELKNGPHSEDKVSL